MRLELGPLPAAPASEWLENARKLVGVFADRADDLPFNVPSDVILDFGHYLDSWSWAARTDPFVWEGELDAFQVRHLMTYWLNIAKVMSEETLVAPSELSPEAGIFYENLVRAILDALAGEDAFADRIQAAWPLNVDGSALHALGGSPPCVSASGSRTSPLRPSTGSAATSTSDSNQCT